MSSSRRRTEHIERTRYPNPLPPPPYPPKLLSIPTPTSRYADPRSLGMRLAQAHPVPMVVDAEAGMPLNMTDFPQAWYTDQELEAGDDVFPVLRQDTEIDDEDAFLLSDMLATKLPVTSNGANHAHNARAGAERGNVTWLRRTEYLGAEQAKRKVDNMAARATGEVIDSSREAQIARIKASFAAANTSLGEIKHPTKPGLTAVDSYSLFPDPDTWATRFDVFRFGDLPGRVTGGRGQQDPRLETAVLRPHRDLLNENIYSLYLVEGKNADERDENGNTRPHKRSKRNVRSLEEELLDENNESASLVDSRLRGEVRDAQVSHGDAGEFDVDESDQLLSRLKHVRDYLPHDETNRKDQELIFTFMEDPSADGLNEVDATSKSTLPPLVTFERSFRRQEQGKERAGPSQKAVYYHPVSSRAQLRVRRRKPQDPLPPEHWDAIHLRKRNLSMYEKVERLHERAIVDDFSTSDIPDRIALPTYDAEDDMAEEGGVAAGAEADIDDAVESAHNDDEDEIAPRAVGSTTPAARPAQHQEADDDDDENVLPRRKVRTTQDAGREDDTGDEQEQGRPGAPSDSDSGSGSDFAGNSDEELDDDELAALRAEAGDDAGMDEAEDEDGGNTRSRRSRRAAASSAAAEETEAYRQQQRARNAELGGDDEDDE